MERYRAADEDAIKNNIRRIEVVKKTKRGGLWTGENEDHKSEHVPDDSGSGVRYAELLSLL